MYDSRAVVPEGCTKHDIKSQGSRHGVFCQNHDVKNEVKLCLIKMSGLDVTCRLSIPVLEHASN